MITLLQRVTEARVEVSNRVIGNIEKGLLVFVGVQTADTEITASEFISRILNYRVFSDENNKMNLSLLDVQGGLLLVPQFTLAANTRKGRRPSFTTAARPEHGLAIFQTMVNIAKSSHGAVMCGEFGADMQVHLINDGPVTFILD